MVSHHSPSLPALCRLLHRSVDNWAPSDYVFIFNQAFTHSSPDYSAVAEVAAAVHVLQMSTFVIDDVLDCADERYHRMSAMATHGPHLAVAAGIYLQSTALAHSLVAFQRHGDICVVDAQRMLLDALTDVYHGQFSDLRQTADHTVSIDDYFACISHTTAQFVARVAALASALAGAPQQTVNAFALYGFQYGLALQIADDIIDVTSNSDRTGKSEATDLASRRMRLPMIVALKALRGTRKVALAGYVNAKPHPTPAEVAVMRDIVLSSGSIITCAQSVRAHVGQACAALTEVRSSESRYMLEALARSLINDIAEYTK